MVKDWSYLAAFKRKDLPSLQKMAAHIRQTHDTDMIEDINQRFEDKASSLQNGIEVLDVTNTKDLAVNAGLQQCINIILGTNLTRWRYMEIGNGSTAPTTTDTALGSGFLPRIDMTTQGWVEPQGMKLTFGAIVGSSVAVSPVRECGVFNNLSFDVMLNHEVFANNPLSRTNHNIIYIISTVVEFCPVV